MPKSRVTVFGPSPFATEAPATSGRSSRPVFPRRHGTGRPAAAGRCRIRRRGRGTGSNRGAARPRQPEPDNQQAITCCFAVDYLDGQDHTIERPAEYDFWRDYVPAAHARVAGTAARFELRRSRSPSSRPAAVSTRAARARVLGLPPDRRPAQFPPRRLSRQFGHDPGELAAERLLARPPDRRRVTRGRRRAAHRTGQAAQPVACSTGSRPNVHGPTAKPAGRGFGSGPTSSAPTTAWPRPPISANRGASGPNSPCIEQHVGTDARRKA